MSFSLSARTETTRHKLLPRCEKIRSSKSYVFQTSTLQAFATGKCEEVRSPNTHKWSNARPLRTASTSNFDKQTSLRNVECLSRQLAMRFMGVCQLQLVKERVSYATAFGGRTKSVLCFRYKASISIVLLILLCLLLPFLGIEAQNKKVVYIANLMCMTRPIKQKWSQKK